MAVLDTSLEFGVLYAFINYIRQFFQPINQITQQWNTLQSTTVSMDRLWRIFRVEPQVTDPEPGQTVAVKPQEVLGQVDFNHIRFAYVDKRDVLHNLDLHIAPGNSSALSARPARAKARSSACWPGSMMSARAASRSTASTFAG